MCERPRSYHEAKNTHVTDRIFDTNSCFSDLFEFFTIRSHLHFKPKLTLRCLRIFSKKLPPEGIELATPTIIRSKVECLSKWAREACAT